jgi:hypothetical protein
MPRAPLFEVAEEGVLRAPSRVYLMRQAYRPSSSSRSRRSSTKAGRAQ